MKYTPALDTDNKLRKMVGDDIPAWLLVERAWSNMPGAANLGHRLTAGMPIEQALVQEANRIDAFADQMREHFARYRADQEELSHLRAQREAVRDFFKGD